jgi:hypothetical protein
MNRKKVLSLLIAFLVLAVAASSTMAALPGSGWWTSFQIQNVGDADATLAYTAYWEVSEGNDTTYSQDGEITLAQDSALIYNPGLEPNYPTGPRIGFDTTDKHLPSGFAGGVEVSADQPIRAVVQVGNNPAGSVGVTGGRASAFYQGTQGDSVGSTINFPSMKHDYFGQTTSFYIQAAGGDATIDATFTSNTGGSYPLTGINIPAGKTYLLDPAAAGVPADTLGSLTVEATSGQVAGVVIETPHSANPATFALSTKGFAPGDYDTTIVAPTNKLDFWGGNTGWQLLNTSDAVDASVVVTFTVTNIQPGSAAETDGIEVGDQYRSEIDILAGESFLFSKGKGTYVAATPLDGAPTMTSGVFFAGLAVSDSAPLVATVNENNGPNRLVYSAFAAGNATTEIASPLVKEDFFGATTGLAVQNVGAGSTDVSLVYNCSTGTGTSKHEATYNVGPYTIEASAANSFINLDNATRWGSVLVESESQCAVSIESTGEPIVALAQESNPNVDTKNYEGFNLAP